MSICYSFNPAADKNTRIMILGSMPGRISLEKNQYYANSRNQFWKIIDMLFKDPLPDNYNERISFLLERGIGLWDTLKSCERSGSLDSDIINPVLNDFSRLKADYPEIRKICFNGSKAYNLFIKNADRDTDNYPQLIKLPSTSPAHAVKLETKLEKWLQLIK